ncbi:MAG: Eco57I restriction-modification methylase domain-containing protein, partial [Kiritimatiellae bacterium]|nr:Eco57I restriction-modification methylase domain-containing protein [Kiritimatiellia bacterium]
FLNFDENYLGNKLKETQTKKGQDKFYESFYRSFLKQLFSDGLDKPVAARSEYFLRKYGRIPYLNGGMFSVHQIEKENKDIDIPDKVFERLFAFFDEWHWHLDNRITASGRDINPDVLGYIFEQYINDRAQMGAYYTKEDITEYIGRNTIIPWVWIKAVGKRDIGEFLVGLSPRDSRTVGSRVPRDRIDRYIFPAMRKGLDLPLPADIAKGVPVEPQSTLRARRANWNKPADEKYALPTEIWRETVSRRQRCEEIRTILERASNPRGSGTLAASDKALTIHDFITYNLDIRTFVEDVIRDTPDHKLVLHFYKALREVTVLDPTCGSGAFLFAALNILEPLYEACLDRMEEFHARNPNLFKDELAEMVGRSPRDRRDRQYFIYKSIILRNLYGVDIMHEATEIARLRLFLKMVAVVDVDEYDPNLGLDPLPDIDFNIRCGNTLVGYASEKEIENALVNGDMFAYAELKGKIDTELGKASMAFDFFRREQLNLTGDRQQLVAAKEEIHKRLAVIRKLLDDHLYASSGSLKKKDAWLRDTQPFHWYTEFYPIMHCRGGFDVIIGNPPYVSSNDVPYMLNNPNDYPDIYALVFERSLLLQAERGHCGLIVPISITFSGKFAGLRRRLLHETRCWLSTYDRIPGALFDGARQRCTICLSTVDTKYELLTTAMMRWKTEAFPTLFTTLAYGNTPNIDFTSRGIPKLPPHFRGVLQALEKNTFCKLHFIESANGDMIRYSATAANFISVSKNSPPCFDAETFSEQPSSKSKSLTVSNEDMAFAAVAALSGDLFFWYWLVRSDGFDITGWILKEFLGAVETLDAKRLHLLSLLGRILNAKTLESLVFKKNAGIYVGNYDYRRLAHFTMRSDMIILSGLGFDFSEFTLLSDYIQRVRAVNVVVGEKGIPDCIRGKVGKRQKRYRNEVQDLKEIDELLAKHYGFTEEELDFIINYDIKYRMGNEPESEARREGSSEAKNGEAARKGPHELNAGE